MKKGEEMVSPKKQQLQANLSEYRLPAFEQIPDVGLYLEQTVYFINEHLKPLNGTNLTSSMVSNYVKQGIIQGPVKKMYYREQIADLFFIAIAKTVLSLNDLKLLMKIQHQTYPLTVAYPYFQAEFQNIWAHVIDENKPLAVIGTEQTEEKAMLQSIIQASSYKIYLDNYFTLLR